MKTSLTTLIILMVLLTGSQQLQAQNIGVSVGPGFGSEIETIGVQAGVLYSFTDDIRSAVDFVYFMPNDSGAIQLTWMELNANAHYFVLSEERYRLYGLAGANYTLISSEVTIFGSKVSSTGSEVGANLGVGFEYLFGMAAGAYVEAKYVLGNADQLGAFGGVRFFF